MELREHAQLLRMAGMSYRAIDVALGLHGRNGNASWRLLKGGDGAGHPPSKWEPVTISLWKKVAGGRSFKDIAKALETFGIRCEKGEKSQWEDRYEIYVAAKDKQAAEDILFAPIPDATFRAQALDSLKDVTR